uniref:hypothetical protein n=1 Tax=Thaumasiovibrio occultus TaxID=1891184 RepID=UPI000B361E40|nr:hypothetical protein [Thaumasiovibrio occultus]
MKIPLSLKNRVKKENEKEFDHEPYIAQIKYWIQEGKPFEAISPEDLVRVVGGSEETAAEALGKCSQDELFQRRTKPVSSDAITQVMNTAIAELNHVFDKQVQSKIAEREASFESSKAKLEQALAQHESTIEQMRSELERVDTQRSALGQRADSMNSELLGEREGREEAEKRCKSLQSLLTEREEHIARLEREIGDAQDQTNMRVTEASASHQQQLNVLQAEYLKLKQTQTQMNESKLAAKQEEIDALEAQLVSVRGALDAANEATVKANRRAEQARAELETVQEELMAVKERQYTGS